MNQQGVYEKIIPAGFEVSQAPIKIIKINKKIEFNDEMINIY